MKDRSLFLKLFTFPQLSTIFIHNSTKRCVHSRFAVQLQKFSLIKAVLSPFLADSDEFLPLWNRMIIFAILAEFCSKTKTLFL